MRCMFVIYADAEGVYLKTGFYEWILNMVYRNVFVAFV